MFGKFFKKNKNQPAVDFNLLNSIIEELISNENLQSQISIKVKGIPEQVSAYW